MYNDGASKENLPGIPNNNKGTFIIILTNNIIINALIYLIFLIIEILSRYFPLFFPQYLLKE